MAKTDKPMDQPDSEPKAPTPAPALDLQDIATSLNLINIAIKRGAYERTELRGVLDVTDKMDVFLKHQVKVQAAEAQKGEQ